VTSVTVSAKAQTALTIRKPDDWHVHLRDGAMLDAVLPFTARHFARAIVMPNLAPPVVTAADAVAYRKRIRAALPPDTAFEPLMTAYLTDSSSPEDIARGHGERAFVAAKLYPAHATTNSAHGVTDMRKIRGVLARMEKIGMPLLVHGEVTDPAVDIFDREAVFIERVLAPLLREHPALKVVFEHVTTAEAVDFVEHTANVAATITPHHLMINRNAIFAGGIRPHMYCLPVAKRETHRLALRRAIASGSSKFFLGTDSAPHPISAKEAECGCAGIFNAPVALPAYAQVFDEEGALDKLEAFASESGPRFYGLPLNNGRVTLTRAPHKVTSRIDTVSEVVRPFLADELVGWTIEGG
jgi:dihydroorotase